MSASRRGSFLDTLVRLIQIGRDRDEGAARPKSWSNYLAVQRRDTSPREQDRGDFQSGIEGWHGGWFHRPPRSFSGVSVRYHLDERSAVGANPSPPPQPIPLCIDRAVPAWGIGRLSPGARCAAVSRERAPSAAVSIASSSRRLPCWEHRDAPVVTTLRGTFTLAASRSIGEGEAVVEGVPRQHQWHRFEVVI